MTSVEYKEDKPKKLRKHIVKDENNKLLEMYDSMIGENAKKIKIKLQVQRELENQLYNPNLGKLNDVAI